MSSTPPTPTPDPRTSRQQLIDNERTRLLDTAMNNASVAVFIAGVAGPAAYDLYGIVAARSPYWADIGICWMAASLVLHTLARHILKGLTP